MGAKYQYTVDLIAQTKQFEQNMQKATSEAKQLAGAAGNVNSAGSKLTSGLSTMGMGLGKLALMIGGPVAALSLLKGAVQSVEGPGDRFEEVVSGGKEALFEFQRALATMNFDDFFRNMVEGYEKGKEFAALLDELADKAAYSDYKVASLKAESALLGETIKNKRLDISVRTAAAEKRTQIEEQVLLRTQDIAQRTFDIEKRGWENRNEMSADEALRLYETIDNLSSETTDRLAKAFDAQTALFGKRKGVEMIASGEAQRGFLKGIPEETIQSYVKYFKLLETGEKDVLIKLFNTYKNIDQVRFESQRSYNLAVRETSMLLNAEEKALDKVFEKSKDVSKISVKVTGVNSKPLTASNELRAAPKMPKVAEIQKLDLAYQTLIDKSALLSQMDNPLEFISGSVKKLSESLGEGADSWNEYAHDVGNSIRGLISGLLAQSIATLVASAISTAALTGPGALILAPILTGVAAGIVKTAFNTLVPEFAEGGLVYGPTIAHVGEYPGASSNPEVITPLSKLKSMLQPAMSEGNVVFRIGDRELVGILERSGRINQNIRGRR